ncbi:MAG: metal-dependent transcriptional regulator [Candidatus Rokubacteria bacterium]|nr:metal-dependent transcriptional regulator [Candidatus Rokubacteria bacterium]
MTRTSPSPAQLECIDAIHRLGAGARAVTLTALARRLRVTGADAGQQVFALQAGGLVVADATSGVRLTAEGERIARRLLRRHRVLERFLTDVLDLPWDRVHDEACRLAPVVSDDVTEGLARLAGHPATCPHGHPIPAADGTLAPDASVPLHRLGAGRSAIVTRVEREDPDLLRYLATLGLLPDTKVEVDEVGALGGPIVVRVGSARYALGRKVAAQIRVRPV